MLRKVYCPVLGHTYIVTFRNPLAVLQAIEKYIVENWRGFVGNIKIPPCKGICAEILPIPYFKMEVWSSRRTCVARLAYILPLFHRELLG